MQTSIETLRHVWEGAEIHKISAGVVFDRFNVAHIKEFDTSQANGIELYFAVYEDDPNREGWYLNPFDRTKKIREFGKRSDIAFVVDSRVSDHVMRGLKYIRVHNVFDAVEQLRRHVLSVVNPRVVGVTGSVGKTTTAALIQHLLGEKLGCGRVYSKRLTPLTLSSWLVNQLDPSHRFLSLEYSMYRPQHVAALMKILKPEIGILLNIKRVHFGVQGVNSLLDIREGKRPLVEEARPGILNSDDELVLSLRKKDDLTFSLSDPRADIFVEENGPTIGVKINLTGESFRFMPYLKTDLCYQQAFAASLVATLLGMKAPEIAEGLESFRPAENRIGWIDIIGEKVLFDGDITGAGRLSALAENRYQSSILLVAKFNFGEEDVHLQADYFAEVFGTFDEVRVLDEVENRDAVARYGIANCSLTSKEHFLSGLSDFEFKVLHFGGYFRKHSTLDHLLLSITDS